MRMMTGWMSHAPASERGKGEGKEWEFERCEMAVSGVYVSMSVRNVKTKGTVRMKKEWIELRE